ncbi:septum formation protein Maf [bacterium]|nr:septum formation protein Maf [bacterium]
MGKIILGSSSPRRANILKKLNIDFEVIPSCYVEEHDQTDFSYNFVENLAYNKALDVAKRLKKESKNLLVVGADTIVVLKNKILEKPIDYEDAFNMLKKLSGNTHFVVTAVCVINSATLEFKTKSETTYVTFENLTEEQISDYIYQFKPYDKAGSYGIQELPDGFVKEVKGELDNVIGLPAKVMLELIDSF